MIELFEKL